MTVLTATRDAAYSAVGLKGKAAKTPDALVEDALNAFTTASVKMDAALAEIDRQNLELVKQRQELDAKIDNTEKAASRLGRVRQRFADLLA